MSALTINRQQPRSILPIRFIGGIGLALSLTMLIFWLVMRPPIVEMQAMLIFLAITAFISLIIGYSAYRLGWLNKMPSLILALISGYALSSGLTFINVWFTARLMFINEHDLVLATILLFFATGIAISLGSFISTAVTDSIKALNRCASRIAGGDLSTRVSVHGRDEMAKLGQAFNGMAIQLEDAARKKAQVEQLRRDLIAWLGHDLRTPLASVRAIVEALADGVVEDPISVERYLNTAKRDINSLSMLLDDLFEMAQIDAGGLRLDKHPNFLSDLISDTLESFSNRAIEKGIVLSGEVAPNVDPVILDAKQIGRVLNNLVNNAIRYSPDNASVHVSAQLQGGLVCVTVADTGDGINAEDLPHIFEQFYRGEKSRNRATGGSGLGLAIAQSIVESHGGQIQIKSQVNRGTSVIFTLPHNGRNLQANPLLRQRIAV
ncbi:HAMP domain-containing protein [Chloroflexi bacterium TSY]|nr:HAMP domain-containing protein [Chloroflexi bacterium TSY]